ncbi:MAG: outer membrane protein [Pseudomonadota bacterium]
MGNHRKCVWVGAIAAILSGPALAADLPPVIEPPVVAPIQDFSGWYIRGDISYDVIDSDSADYTGSNFPGQFFNDDWDEAVNIGAGVGYQFNRYFRTDITVDYRQTQYDADAKCASHPAPCTVGGVAAPRNFTEESADASIWTAMANAYVDVAHWHGLTPYVGAGIGIAYIDVTDYEGETWDGTSFVATSFDDNDQVNFAASLMAGFSYDITEFLKVDAGYRYTYLGDIETGTNPLDTGPTSEAVVEWESMDMHEARLGIRYMIY